MGSRSAQGHTVIAADVRRQPALLKKPLKHGESVVFFGGRESLAGQQVSAGMIGDRQRAAIVLIPQQELSKWLPCPWPRTGWLFYNAKYRPQMKNHVTSYSRYVYSEGFAEDRT